MLLTTPVPHEEAARLIRGKLPATRKLFDAMAPELQAAAVVITGVEDLHAIERVRNLVAEIPEGFKAPADTSLAQAVQSEVHPARVGLYDLRSGEQLLRLHRTVYVTVPAIPGDAATVEAQRRQILNCALAQEVSAAISGQLTRASAPASPPRSAGGTRPRARSSPPPAP